MNIFRKSLLAMTFVVPVFAVNAQEETVAENNEEQPIVAEQTAEVKVKKTLPADFCPHRINVYIGNSYHNNIYTRVNDAFAKPIYSFGSVVELKYAYFFNEHWGISLGAGLANFHAKARLDLEGVIPHYDDLNFDPGLYGAERFYDLHYKATALVEEQNLWAAEVPLQAHFEDKFGGKNGIYASLGVKGYFPFAAKSKFTGEGSLTTWGYEEFMNVEYRDLPNRFGTSTINTETAKAKLRPSVDVIADFGGIIGLYPALDLYVGVYGSYGFLDVLPKTENKIDFITNTPASPTTVNSLLGSKFLNEYKEIYAPANNWKTVSEKWNMWQVGVKVGFHIKPCCALNKKPSMRERKEQYYESMAEERKAPIFVRDTVITPPEPIDTNIWQKKPEPPKGLTPEQKANREALLKALSKIKILFDLDKDIPKIDDAGNHIDKTAEIMKTDESLILQIEGYTCDLGTETHNRDLAQRRAEAVREIFILKGVNASQIRCVTYTAENEQNRENIRSPQREEHRAVIFRILEK